MILISTFIISPVALIIFAALFFLVSFVLLPLAMAKNKLKVFKKLTILEDGKVEDNFNNTFSSVVIKDSVVTFEANESVKKVNLVISLKSKKRIRNSIVNISFGERKATVNLEKFDEIAISVLSVNGVKAKKNKTYGHNTFLLFLLALIQSGLTALEMFLIAFSYSGFLRRYTPEYASVYYLAFSSLIILVVSFVVNKLLLSKELKGGK